MTGRVNQTGCPAQLRHGILQRAMITSTHTVCVVIPVYTATLRPFEQAALDRCIAILGKHPIVIVKPETLSLDEWRNRYPQLQHENFPDEYFAGIKSYNRLLLSDSFYARFSAYEFMLIYQLDAFVFSDQLLTWCASGYDYIGAPWIPKSCAPSTWSLLRATIRRRIFRLIGKRYSNGVTEHHAQQHYSAGNGGFSLRRIGKMREVLTRLPQRAEPYRQGSRDPWAEDLFFSIEANRYRQNLRIPGFRKATAFAWETFPSVAAPFNAGRLPFGCHAWNKLHRDDWQPIFAQLGLSLDVLLAPSNNSHVKNADSNTAHNL